MVKKYINVLSPDSDAKDRVNKNIKHQKMSVVSQNLPITGITTIEYTKLTDDDGNALTFQAGDVITEASIIFTTAQVAGTSGLLTLGSGTAAGTYRNIISGFSTSSGIGTLYKALSTNNGTSVSTMPFVVTADGTELYFSMKQTAASTAGAVRVVVDFSVLEL